MIGQLELLFTTTTSLDFNTTTKIRFVDSEQLKLNVDRALRWLVTKINLAKLDPIAIKISSLENISEDIKQGLFDPRCKTNIKYLK